MNKTEHLKILFKVKGGHDFGTGHMMRSLELADEFRAKSKVTFFCNHDEHVLQKIDKRGYDLFFTSKKDQDAEAEEVTRIVRDRGIDIVIIDQPDTCRGLCKRLKEKYPKLYIVGLDYFDSESDIDVIINLWNRNIRFKHRKNMRYYEGLQYAIIRDSFKKYAKMNKEINDRPERIIVTFGGGDPNQNTVKILKLLDKISDQSFKLNVIIGLAFEDEEIIFNTADKSKHACTIQKNVSNFEKLVFEADLGFTGAGTTMMEFCGVGTPVIVYPQNEQEELFAKIFEEKGAVRLINGNDEKEALAIIRETVSDVDIRKIMSKRQKELIDTRGKARINDIILKNYDFVKRSVK